MKIILLLIVTFLSINLSAQTLENETQCPCDYPSLSFKGDDAGLTDGIKKTLAVIANKLKQYPFCEITINGYSTPSKRDQNNCQKRLIAVKLYLIERLGISYDRIMTSCDVVRSGKNSVDIKCN